MHAHGFVYLPCHVFKALSSKKKSKGRKGPKPAKPQGRTFIHHPNNDFCIRSLHSGPIVLGVILNTVCVPCVTAADEDSDDMFKPPKMDDDDFSPFGGKGGLFSGGKGLFDDDEEVY